MILGKLLFVIPRNMTPGELRFHRYFPLSSEVENQFSPEDSDEKKKQLTEQLELMLTETGKAEDATENQGFWTAPKDSPAERYMTQLGSIFVRLVAIALTIDCSISDCGIFSIIYVCAGHLQDKNTERGRQHQVLEMGKAVLTAVVLALVGKRY